MEAIDCIALRKKTPLRNGKWLGDYLWLICNGMNAGRWTLFFGSPCIADIPDCKDIVRFNKEKFPESEIIEVKIVFKEGGV